LGFGGREKKMSVKAAIDIGTNSIKLLVMRKDKKDAAASVLADRNEVARLGGGAAARGSLSEEAMIRSALVISDMACEARELGCDEILAVATQALRSAQNSEVFKDMVRNACGVDLKVITGEEEAELSFRAVISALPENVARVCVFDVGGGSSEIITGGRIGIDYRRSVPVGALSLHDEFFGASAENEDDVPADMAAAISAAREKTRRELRGEDAELLPDSVSFAGVGGTITTLAAVALASDPYDPSKISGVTLDAPEIDRQIRLFAETSVRDRTKIKGLNPKRADIILAGACLVRELMDYAGALRLTVLDRGLRYGVMEKYLGLK
jgi:exopolyphosphatase/guanosine-5'-triphosphate,3'-diphosphate pyrophosphatase